MSDLSIGRWHDPVRRVDVVRAADFDALLKRYESLREDVIVPGLKANDALKARVKDLEAKNIPTAGRGEAVNEKLLTNDQCKAVIQDLEAQEWSGLTNDDIRLIDSFIQHARSQHSQRDGEVNDH